MNDTPKFATLAGLLYDNLDSRVARIRGLVKEIVKIPSRELATEAAIDLASGGSLGGRVLAEYRLGKREVEHLLAAYPADTPLGYELRAAIRHIID